MGGEREGWVPPHCPNAKCVFHNGLREHWRFVRRGFYRRRATPECIPRFTCLCCGRHFSTQSFRFTYWQKRPELIEPIASMVVGCMANRQIARALRCSPSTVAHHIARLGRHALLFQARELGRLRITGEVAIDGFESFEWSQYFPYHHNVAVEVDSGYFLYHTDSPLRRKGRMREQQRRRRRELESHLGRPEPRSVEIGIRDLLEPLAERTQQLRLRSDDHRAYPRAIRTLPIPTEHRVTSSRVRRTNRNPLWEVNLLDLMIRHSTAAHKRETIAWARRRQASIEKLAIFQVWRNYIKRRREKGDCVTSAMQLGVAKTPWRIRDVLAGRRFFHKTKLSHRWEQYYRRDVDTSALPVNRRHTLTYAF